MKYSAHYKLTPELKTAILSAAQDMCLSDRYYPRQIQNGTPRYGCALYGKTPANWEELEEMTTGNMALCHATQVEHRVWLRWRTSGGNVEGILVSGDVVIYVREGRRHGIPMFFREVFEGLTPLWGTESYDSRRKDVSPFAMGV